MMNRTIKLYIFFLVLIVVGLVFVEANRPKPINWNQSYSVRDKIPFGLYVFDKEFDKVFENKIERMYETPYEFFDKEYDWDTEEYNIEGTFFYVNSYNMIDEQSIEELMVFVSKGNSAFISSSNFPHKLLDSLNLETAYKRFEELKEITHKDSTKTYLSNKLFGKEKYNITVGSSEIGFSKIDTLNTIVLGYQEYNHTKEKQINFVRAPYKNGFFYLHTQPAVFTNYHLLKKQNFRYTQNVLSYLSDDQKIYWHIKGQSGEIVNYSPLRYIASQPALKYAWYLLIFTGIIFVIFNIKRKQRIVPIIKPLENTTVDFTKTIGNLYYQQKDHKSIIDKKITYFLEKVRTQYMLDTKVLDEAFVKKFHLKSGKNIEDIQKVVDLINKFEKSGHFSENHLIELNRAIEKIS